jgi:hypothetical protein
MWTVGITHEGMIAFGDGNGTATFESRFDMQVGGLSFKSFKAGKYTITIKPLN